MASLNMAVFCVCGTAEAYSFNVSGLPENHETDVKNIHHDPLVQPKKHYPSISSHQTGSDKILSKRSTREVQVLPT